MTNISKLRDWSMTVFTRVCVIIIFSIMVLTQMAHAKDDKLVVAHRGASGYLPEHTLAAKALAYGMGAHYIEQDVVATKDGVLIVLHDIYLGTVTNVEEVFPDRKRADGLYYAIDFTLAEIKTLEVHERTRKNSKNSVFSGRFPQGKSSFRISTLAEEIELVQGLNQSTGRDVGIFPEVKNPEFHRKNDQDLSKSLLEVLDRYGYRKMEDKVIIQCFDWKETQRIRNELGYQGKLVQLLGENSWGIFANTNFDYLKSAEGLKEIATIAQGIGPWINQIVKGVKADGSGDLTPLIHDAKAVGLSIFPYTARADALPSWAKDYNHLLSVIYNDAGSDGVFTDFTDKTVKFLGQ